jgi:hypothetical protein
VKRRLLHFNLLAVDPCILLPAFSAGVYRNTIAWLSGAMRASLPSRILLDRLGMMGNLIVIGIRI